MSREDNQEEWETIHGALQQQPTLWESMQRLKEISSDFSASSFLEEVDQSDYSLVDWVEALIEFDAWLTTENVSARPFPTMLGYIHCCTMMSPSTISLPSLKVIVYQSLTKFGFDAISDFQN